MNQEEFGKLIKEIRKNNNLTQKQLADKYNVTYQAVSKWENGKNLPDMFLINQICKDYNISLDKVFNSTNSKLKNKKLIMIISSAIILILILLLFIFIKNNSNFEFKTISTNVDNFDISGSIAYNDSKSSIYITNIKYSGEKTNKIYKSFECTLYESNEKINNEISSCSYDSNESITLSEFLSSVTLSKDNYSKICKTYSDTSLYLTVKAKDFNDEVTLFNIPLLLDDSCSN